jgi:hypothetical protein
MLFTCTPFFLCCQTGALVRVSGIITQLVFEHALRIRVKAETSSTPRTTPAVTPETTTPDNVSLLDNDVSETVDGSGEEIGQSTTSSSIKGKQKEEFPASIASINNGDDPGNTSNLVGKMNNLASSDLENIVEGRDFLLLGPLFDHLSRLSLTSLPPARSFVFPPSGYYVHLVLIQHPWLECICRVRSDGRPFPCPWHPRK